MAAKARRELWPTLASQRIRRITAMLAGCSAWLLLAASGASAFPNSSIAAIAERYPNGSRQGQCIVFVKRVVERASGKVISAYAHGYQATFAANGAKLIAQPSKAARGDIIQITPPGTSDSWKGPERMPLHTAIIRKNLGSGRFAVIDSNYGLDERVQRHTLNPYDFAARYRGGIVKIWRFGSVGASPIGRLDRVGALSGGRIAVAGWAFDPDGRTQPVRVEAWIDGRRGQAGARRVDLGYATLIRRDVARVHKGAGSRHGFEKVIGGIAPGTHAVRVYALNRFKGGATTYLGGKTVRVPAPVPEPDDPLDGEPLAPVFEQGQHNWTAGAGPEYQSFMGDFNGDHQVDLGLRRITDGTFYWRLGPDFRQGRQTWSAGAGPEYQSFMGDFNGDRQVDIGLRRTTNGSFYWRLGPSFEQTRYGWVAGGEYQSFMGDFNGDHQVDIGLRRTTDGQFYWRLGPDFLQQGRQTWGAGAGPEYQSFMGDFNGDKQVDIGLRRTTNGSFYWRLGPSFEQTRYGWAAGSEYQSFMGDFNGDHLVDIGLRRTGDGAFYWRLQTASVARRSSA